MLVAGVAGGSLGAALSHFRLKFAADDIGHVVRSLAYFGDADADPLPAGLESKQWATIKAWFEREVSALE